MARTLLLAFGAALLLASACGDSTVIVPGGTTSTATGGEGGDAADGGGGAGGQTTASGGASPCQAAACGDPCTVCNDLECLEGLCDVDGSCAPFDEGSCPSGVGGAGGAPACPPPEEVNLQVPCSNEGQTCPSESSCSGVLDCQEGQWTLLQLC